MVLPVYASDFRDKVGSSLPSANTNIIDPDKHIFGTPFGTTEDEFIKKYGKPTGYIQLADGITAMLYGTKVLIFFKDHNLSGIRIGYDIFDTEISKEIFSSTSTPFDNIKWELNNGIKERMGLIEVKNILGDKLLTINENFKKYYNTQNSCIEMSFSYSSNLGKRNEDKAYRLFSITIKPK
jgi:hypothetical protein